MATSGSSNFDLTRNEIIIDALIHCGANEQGEAPAAEDTAFAARELNRMVKAWQASGTHLWKTKEAVVFLTKGTAKYSLGNASSDDEASLSHVKTELSAAAASGASTITVDSITGVADADTVGVVQDDGTIHWTTVNGAPSGSTVTLTAVTTAAAAVDNHVYAYTTKLVRPLRMLTARRRDEADQDIPMLEWARSDYFGTPNKTTEAPPTAVYYDPQLGSGVLYLWPAPDTVNDRILLTVDIPIEDYADTSNTSDLPQEWLSALTWNLADQLVPSYGVPERLALRIERRAISSLALVAGWDRETGSVQFAAELSYG